jgi:2-keto-3-deoxy-L-rhamnonate aldolase RhmA
VARPDRFELLLFSTEREFVLEAAAAGIDGIIVDWEVAGKERRQAGADTEINHDTLEDLERVRSWVDLPVLCRINSPGPMTERELESAIGAGADEVLVPMARSPHELERVIEAARERCGVGALIETVEAVERVREFAALPLSRLYVGLNDLSIDRRSSSIFTALVDGTVERVSAAVDGSFGFGGLTAPDRGYPIPCRLLIGELIRLGSSFSFLRRSYKRDVGGEGQAALVARLRSALTEACARTPLEIERDRRELAEAVAAWPGCARPEAGTLI